MLCLRRHWDVLERDTVGFDDFTMVFVIGNHAGDDEREILGDVTGQQIVEAVFLFGAEQDDAAWLRGVGDFPIHRKLLGQRSEALGKFAGGEIERFRADLDAHEEAGEFVLGMLAGFRDPALVAGDERGHLGHDAAGIGAGEAEGKRAGHGCRMEGEGRRGQDTAAGAPLRRVFYRQRCPPSACLRD